MSFEKDIIKSLHLPPDVEKQVLAARRKAIRDLKSKRRLIENQGRHLAKLHRDQNGVWAPGYKEQFKTIIRARNSLGLSLKKLGAEKKAPNYDPY